MHSCIIFQIIVFFCLLSAWVMKDESYEKNAKNKATVRGSFVEYQFCEHYPSRIHISKRAPISNKPEQPSAVTNFHLVWHRHIHAGNGVSATDLLVVFVKLVIFPTVVLAWVCKKAVLKDEHSEAAQKCTFKVVFDILNRWYESAVFKFQSTILGAGARRHVKSGKVSLKVGSHNIKNLKPTSDTLFSFYQRKPNVDHLLKFQRSQCFNQTCTVCPAVSLTSHFSSGAYGQPGSAQELNKEGVRLSTFKNFPTSIPVSAMRMAQAGFYYTGERDITKCFSCGVTYQGWQMGDRPSLVHARISPGCPLVKGIDAANMPLPMPVSSRPVFSEGASASLDSGYGSRSYDSSSGSVSNVLHNTDELQHDSAPDSVTDQVSMPSSGPQAAASSATFGASLSNGKPIPSSLATPENSMFSGAPLFGRATPMDGGAPRNQPMPARRLDLSGAVYPLYSQMDARKRSYTNWVADRGLPPVDELVTLGFFYAGYADCVRCFFCGIGLKSWEPGDVPAEVHARWRPTCEYLRLVKGDEFVDQVANPGRSAVTTGESTAPPSDSVQVNSGSSTTPSTGNSPTQVPDIPVVRRARETGYTDLQIAEGIEKLRAIGMERAIEVMLVEVLTNLFRDNPPQPSNSRQSASGLPQPLPGNSGGSSEPISVGPSDPISGDSGFVSALSNQFTEKLQTNEVLQMDAPSESENQEPRENSLQQENARLRNMRICQKCKQQPVGVIFLPCGHIVSCTTCAPDIRRCLRCDTVIRATANVFFS